jgi:spermidine/putrescine transport system ATP-binding protein
MTNIAVELVNVTKTFHDTGTSRGFDALTNLSLSILEGEFFTLLGPSGCGKTTTLRLVAGFEQPTSGKVYVEGKLMNDLPPYRRPVNTVFQKYALFPHLTVAQNISYGLVSHKVPRAEQERSVEQMLKLVQLVGVDRRMPSQLSGGQQQRVALARALVNHPEVLLLDEPLNSLDLQLRKQMQLELKHIQSKTGVTFIYVTHDQEEALTMSNRIAVMNQGVVLQLGTPKEIYDQPENRFVASFIGESNFIEAVVAESHGNDLMMRLWDGQNFDLPAHGKRATTGQRVTLAVRPEKLKLSAKEHIREAGEIQILGTVIESVYAGINTQYLISLQNREPIKINITNAGMYTTGEFQAGQNVYICCAVEDLRLVAAE